MAFGRQKHRKQQLKLSWFYFSRIIRCLDVGSLGLVQWLQGATRDPAASAFSMRSQVCCLNSVSVCIPGRNRGTAKGKCVFQRTPQPMVSLFL